jgi:hypothetical protein
MRHSSPASSGACVCMLVFEWGAGARGWWGGGSRGWGWRCAAGATLHPPCLARQQDACCMAPACALTLPLAFPESGPGLGLRTAAAMRLHRHGRGPSLPQVHPVPEPARPAPHRAGGVQAAAGAQRRRPAGGALRRGLPGAEGGQVTVRDRLWGWGGRAALAGPVARATGWLPRVGGLHCSAATASTRQPPRQPVTALAVHA